MLAHTNCLPRRSAAYGLETHDFSAREGALYGTNPYVCVLASTVRRLSILLQNHDFRSSAAPWSPADGSVGSIGPAGTFLGHTNRLLRRSAPLGHQKHGFELRASDVYPCEN